MILLTFRFEDVYQYNGVLDALHEAAIKLNLYDKVPCSTSL